MSDVTVRRATPDEIASYVIPTWLSSYALGFVGKLMRADSRHAIGRPKYWSEQRGKIERILSTPTVSVRVSEFDGEAIGWVCDDATSRRLHYVFVNRNFRRQTVARGMLPAWFDDAAGGPVYLSHLPPPWYSRPNNDGSRPPWREHVVIDLVSAA